MGNRVDVPQIIETGAWSTALHKQSIFSHPVEVIHLTDSILTRHVAVITEDEFGLLLNEVKVFGEGKCIIKRQTLFCSPTQDKPENTTKFSSH